MAWLQGGQKKLIMGQQKKTNQTFNSLRIFAQSLIK